MQSFMSITLSEREQSRAAKPPMKRTHNAQALSDQLTDPS
ncbi:hypothetical protein QE422_000163 [Chryseobacterium sp. SORGH_AS 447]|nr:hypothetical protein [Chryseobacterium sp. SORGH_AS_0447]